MRFLLVIIVVLLLAWKLWPQQAVPTAEESFIGPQLEPLNKAKKVEDQYMEALERTDKRIEKASDGG